VGCEGSGLPFGQIRFQSSSPLSQPFAPVDLPGQESRQEICAIFAYLPALNLGATQRAEIEV
jgi:hypothetical protein